MRPAILLGIVLAPAIAACGGGGADRNCLTPEDYGAATLTAQVAEGEGAVPATPDFIGFEAQLNDDAKPDLIGLEFYKGSGVFATNIVPGTYTLSGVELNYSTCGMCVRAFTDYDDAAMMTADEEYYATGGTIVITEVNPNIKGTFSDLELEQVTVDPNSTPPFKSTPVADGCTTTIASGSFDVAVTFTAAN